MPGLIRSFKWLIRPRGVSLNANSISVEESKTYQLIATITPDWVKNNKIKWNSSDTSIATVDNNWLVTAVSSGNCTITATTEDKWFTSTCSCEVWVISITSFQLNKTSTSITYWNTEQLTVTISPNNATYKWVIWSSSDTSVATVNSNWVITPVWEWNCTITCTSEDGIHSASCTVTIDLIHVTWITLNKSSTEILAWKTEQLTATITPSDANVKTVNWTSSNTSVATVSSTWLVTYVADGNCVITATTVDWWYTATCNVTCSSFTPVDRCFSYTWWQQTITLEPHKYCIEVWWAQGWGSYNNNPGAKWAYAAWTIEFTSQTTLYIYVWWQWWCSNSLWCHSWIAWWYNWWWTWWGTYYSGWCSSVWWGWGGTDVRYNWATLCNRFIVAWGWAGWWSQRCSSYYYYSCGWGWADNWCWVWCWTQTAAWRCWWFWQWANATAPSNWRSTTPGWGWGWYWWGWCCVNDSAWTSSALVCASGWSSYTYTSSTCWNHPNKACLWNLPLMTNAVCCWCWSSFPTASWGTETWHSWCGCVRIRSL